MKKPSEEELAKIRHHKLMQKKVHRIDEVRQLAKSILEKRKKHGGTCKCNGCSRPK